MKILVTGGAGFIGSNVVKHLLNQNEQVRVLHLPNENLANLKGLNVELVPGNILDKEAVDQAMDGCSSVYHLAAIYAIWMPEPRIMMDVNIEGSRNIFDACLKHKIEKIVYTSSLVRYGGQGIGNTCTEESPFRMGESGDQYCISKYRAHELAEQYAREKDLNITIVCPSLPVGPGDIGPTPTGKYIKYSIDAPLLSYTNDVTNVADVRDIAMGHLLAMEKGQQGRSYILGNPNNTTMKDLLALCRRINKRFIPLIKVTPLALRLIGLGMQITATFVTRKAPLLTYEAVVANQMGLAADCSRAIDELGYTCRPIEESVQDAMDWFKVNT